MLNSVSIKALLSPNKYKSIHVMLKCVNLFDFLMLPILINKAVTITRLCQE
jgi:hypothetical protein